MVLKIPLRLRAGLLVVAALIAPACGVTYFAQAARGQLAVMRARQPIDKVIAQPTTPDSLKEQLLLARRIRDFASKELGLPDNGAYRSYADIGRRYVAWNVVAVPEFEVTPKQWCFPIAGCLAYRGYFSEEAARVYAETLKNKDYDVLVGGVPAYSTLGRIADPLLSTVINYSELDLAALVFHELAHQLAWLPGDTAYNEAFATAVEEEGVARYAERLGDPAVLKSWQERRRMRVQVTALMAQARADLARLYRQRLAPETMRGRKAARLARLADDIRALEQHSGRPSGYASWIDAGLNNAHLASVATYYDKVPRFERLLRKDCGYFLPCFYSKVQAEVRVRSAAGTKTAAGEKKKASPPSGEASRQKT